MAVVKTPTLRGRRLALELRRLRERSDLGQAEVARRLSWSRSKISRIEDAATRPTAKDVQGLLQLYGLDSDRHDAILQLLEDSWQRGWWTAYGDAFTGNYVLLEDQAPEIRGYETTAVPGLLQTPDYARALIRGVRRVEANELDRLVAARIARQAVLERVNPPDVHFVISESVLRFQIEHADLMRKQVSALWQAAVERPNVTIQILPFTAAIPHALEGPFTLFSFPGDHGLDVGHSEGALGEWYAESEAQLTRLRVAFAGVCEAALSPAESADWLAARTRE
ncbi:helix-turn-helix transcriptional regulator [Actinomadura viridis]|uniref:Transcriptional regulator with XRE-family HTH domain n=1 Tax=Actinomadura viridis TaxID=58110 RepID=A0A931DKR7_9ACTN|nr:helix-turn-helix transcriptional regulator [Actinomadura viridis]MBG6089877.1 transcriptional regulator with XRE-family HTH domain [Actinomadura viridis]